MKIAFFIMAMLWVPVFLIYPLMTHGQGTSRNMSVNVFSEPYVESPVLSYRWTGEIYRSCEISLRRSVTDSLGIVHILASTPTLPPIPRSSLGETSYIVDVPVGANLAPGPAVYTVWEVPKCSWIQRLWPVAVPYPPVHFNVIRAYE